MKNINEVAKTRTPMREQEPKVRARNFLEVPYGYSPEEAHLEAARCLQCPRPMCVTGCPVNVNIPEFVHLIDEGDFAGAARAIKKTNALPAVCGRVCPQENQCESKCVLGKKFQPVAIGRLERFAADYERENGLVQIPEKEPSTGKKVAIIGSGPSGLAVAGDLILRGHDVTIFEAFHKAGGVLMYGIPEFRLPKDIVQKEIQYLEKLGVQFELNQVGGQSVDVRELLEKEGFDAVFLGVGAGLPAFMDIPGTELGNVYSANEYLTRSNLMKAYRFPEYDTPIAVGRNVCVVGGGNVAMDAARTAMRLGAESVKIVYRRSEAELPARAEEVHHAKEEGIEFCLLTSPISLQGDEDGMLASMTCVKMELGEPDASGRRRPVEVAGSEYTFDTDLVIFSVGTGANPIITHSVDGLELNKRGYIVADENGRTSIDGVWAGGDIVTGAATVIKAMGAGRVAAKDMHEWLSQK
ncbi:MAG: NADPH-dependent glutamate synthase [Planctomycetia bacterium]|nr:NADPH-dependent glutamate synthase [Planctomycetia bacterium]